MKKGMGFFVVASLLVMLVSCSKEAQVSSLKKTAATQPATSVMTATSYNSLIAYKNSAHQLAFGWVGQSYNGTGITGHFTDLPDSLDIAATFFGDLENYPTLVNELSTVQSTKGTKFLFNIFSTDFPNSTYAHTNAGIIQYASDLKDSVNKYGLNGIILDYEPHYQGVPISQLFFGSQANMSTLIAAVGKYFGLQSNTGKLLAIAGEPGFIKDTCAKYVNYAIVQYYNGTSASGLQSKYDNDSYSEPTSSIFPPSKLIVAETFEGNNWQNGGVPFTTTSGSTVPSFLGIAAWNPTQGNKAGYGAWHMELDHQNNPPYKWYKQAIQLTNPASGFNSSSYYKIKNHTSGLVLDGKGSTTVGSAVGQWSDVTSYNLQWQIIQLSDGYYKIKNHTSGLVLDGKGLTTSGSAVGQWSDVTSNNLEWQIVLQPDGYYKLINHTSGLVLDGEGLTTSGSAVDQVSDVTSNNLEWQIN